MSYGLLTNGVPVIAKTLSHCSQASVIIFPFLLRVSVINALKLCASSIINNVLSLTYLLGFLQNFSYVSNLYLLSLISNPYCFNASTKLKSREGGDIITTL